MVGFYCCVPQCGNHDPKLYDIWVERLRLNQLISVNPEAAYRRYRVCDLHFSEFCRIPGSRKLKFGSLPTLNLPGYNEDSKEYGREVVSNVCTPSISSLPAEQQMPDAFERPESPLLKPPILAYKVSAPRRKRTQLLQGLNIRSQIDLTPKAKRLYKTASNLRRVVRKLNFEKASNKEQITAAKRYIDSQQFALNRLNRASFNFFVSQTRDQVKRSQGRRYTKQNKIFSLSLLKQSPRSYRFLQKVFALPSRRLLTEMLNRLNFGCGINKHIMQHLRKSVQKMEDKDKNCVLLFDEMAINVSSSYDSARDKIIGWEDYGEGNSSSCKFADHVLVFMLRGIRKKWKRPIAFVFPEYSCKKIQLVKLIKNIIRSTKEAGLTVVGTVYDQGSNNRAAIKHLKEESNIYANQHNMSRYEGFLIDGDQIIPIYDPPHLLKGIRNNFLQKDALFKVDGEGHNVHLGRTCCHFTN